MIYIRIFFPQWDDTSSPLGVEFHKLRVVWKYIAIVIILFNEFIAIQSNDSHLNLLLSIWSMFWTNHKVCVTSFFNMTFFFFLLLLLSQNVIDLYLDALDFFYTIAVIGSQLYQKV